MIIDNSCHKTFSISGALAFGVKESSKVNNVLTVLNIAVVLVVIIAGAIKGMFILHIYLNIIFW